VHAGFRTPFGLGLGDFFAEVLNDLLAFAKVTGGKNAAAVDAGLANDVEDVLRAGGHGRRD
jgi:hypothetical protein